MANDLGNLPECMANPANGIEKFRAKYRNRHKAQCGFFTLNCEQF
jgi:hypothetical protein